MSIPPLTALPLDALRRRSSTKWRAYPADVLPLFVAETDFPLAETITQTLRTAVELGDTGYTPPSPGLGAAFAGFAARRFGWDVDPSRVRSTGDVMMGVVELLRATLSPGDRVVITPPVYPPFSMCVAEAGGVVASVPLRRTDDAWHLDLAGIDQSLAAGARAVLLCNPHNPTGTVHSADTLRELAEIAARHGAAVISDEIHAPLVHAPNVFTPFLAASSTAARVGFAVTSASKAFNLAGLKCALMISAAEGPAAVVAGLVPEVEWRTGLFGALAGVAAFDEASDSWLDALMSTLDRNRHMLVGLLAEHLPAAHYRVPDAGFLAWINLSAYDLGAAPAAATLNGARVALNEGTTFGTEGAGYVRLNFGCAPEVLRDAVARMGAFVTAR